MPLGTPEQAILPSSTLAVVTELALALPARGSISRHDDANTIQLPCTDGHASAASRAWRYLGTAPFFVQVEHLAGWDRWRSGDDRSRNEG